MIASATRRIQETETSTILRRIAEKDKTAVKDCIDTYGNFIWAWARKLTASREEAEAATEEILLIFGDTASASATLNQPKKTDCDASVD
ncbi:MAG: hypothetical protein M3449_01245 [Acidobacteriota bacterium]|nr:hypothetical protein [Blastocatellia bacterium]MDQ3489681.1 hypothetical protein [Acidobacteriota bacterium]